MKVVNKKANFNYTLFPERIEAGIALKGIEAKSFRDNRIDLLNSFVKIINGEVYLVNANIPAKGLQKYDPTRARKLLLHKREIIKLITKTKQQKLQIVAVSMYNKHRKIKLELALAKPKRKFDKKESIKKHDVQRDIERELKGL